MSLTENKDEGTTIDQLNDDCLDYIFMFLGIKEKVKMSLVCKRWYLATERSWASLKLLDLRDKELFPVSNGPVGKNLEFSINILNKRGPYFRKLYVEIDNLAYFSEPYQKASISALESCINLTHLYISAKRNVHPGYPKHDLFNIFRNKNSLKCLHLTNITFFGTMFYRLPEDQITEISINFCSFNLLFLNKFKNLKRFEFRGDSLDILKALDESRDYIFVKGPMKAENIHEICIEKSDNNEEDEINNKVHNKLGLFLSSQKNLKKLRLIYFVINKNFIQSFPNTIEELVLENCKFSDESFYFLEFCKNLKIFYCESVYFQCCCHYINIICNSKNLEYFTLINKNEDRSEVDSWLNCIDKLVKSLSECTSLKKFVIKSLHVTTND